MSVTRHNDHWPSYLPGPRDDILAIGVITPTYGLLENMFRHVFAVVTRLNDHQIAAIFERLSNNGRLGALAEMLSKTTLPNILKESVIHFCKGFSICADNRNAIMHSHSGGLYTDYKRNTRGFFLQKFNRSGKKTAYPASLSDLRKLADSTHDFAMFGAAITSDIRIYLLCWERGDDPASVRIPSRDRPPLPAQLSWRSPDSRERPNPPESSQE